MVFFKKNFPFLLVIFLTFFAIAPILQPGFFPMHDDIQATRVFEMHEALQAGQFPVRIVGNLGYGYGYPLFNFYAPLPYYIGAAFMFVGFDALLATKIMFAFGVLLSGIGMYLLAKRVWGTSGAFISALFYVFLPYHAVQIYVRGAVGEYFAYTFLPFVILSLIEVAQRPKFAVFLGSISIAAVILSHNIIGMLTVLIVVFWIICKCVLALKSKETGKEPGILALILLMGLGLAAFFWIPAVFEAKLTNSSTLIQGGSDYRQHFVEIDQLWDSPWGYAGSTLGRNDGMSFKIGKLHLIIFLTTCALFLVKKIRTSQMFLFISNLGLAAVSVFMTLNISRYVWSAFPLLAYIQYPWRFLVFIGFALSFGSGGITMALNGISKYLRMIIIACLFTLLLLFNTKYFQPQYLNAKTAKDYTDIHLINWNISKISDEYLPKGFKVPQTFAEIATNKITTTDGIIVKTSDVSAHRVTVSIDAQKSGNLGIRSIDFPRWRFFLDTVEIFPVYSENQFIIGLLKGDHILVAFFEDTKLRVLGNVISAITAVILVVYFSKMRYKKIY